MATMHEIDYQIHGDDMQFVEVELDPAEAVVAEAGGMMFMEDGIQMETIFGDGSQQSSSGFMGTLLGAGKRLLTGESLFMTVFLEPRQRQEEARFRRALSGQNHSGASRGDRRRAHRAERLVPVRGQRRERRHRVQPSASAPGSSAAKVSSCNGCRATGSRSFTRAAPFFSAISAAGEMLARGYRLHRGVSADVDYDIQFVGNIKSALFGGEGLFFATLRGPGRVWLQSLPLSRLAGRIVAAVPGLSRGGREEGSVLGGLGRMLDGDNS